MINKEAINHITFYSASAGSGKTYTLTHKIAELVDTGKKCSDVKDVVKPSELILTTFTVAAAADFKARAREVLYEKGLCEQAEQLDMAQIGTIDSIAQDFVSRYWYLCGQSPTLNVIDDAGKKRYISQSLATIATEDDVHLFDEVFEEFRFQKYEGKFIDNPDYWKEWLDTLVQMTVNYNIQDLTASCEASKAWLKDVLETMNERSLPSYETRRRWADEFLNADTKASASQTQRVVLYNMLKSETLRFFEYKTLNASKGLASCPNKIRTELIDDCLAEIPYYTRSQEMYDILCRAVDCAFKLVARWKDEYKDFKRQHQLIDFTDMERLFLELLSRPEIEAELRGRYRVLMVDEFQDSSPLQVKIFLRLNEMMEHSYWCGDPKQSIYGFRGSDYELTTAVAEIIAETPENLKTLDTSYRSVPELVNFANNLFRGRFNAGDIENTELKSHRSSSDSALPPLLHWQSEASNKDGRAADMANQIKLFQKEHNIAWKDMAVLAAEHDDFKELITALKKMGVPVNYTTGKLAGTREVALMQSLMVLVADTTNPQARAQVAFLTDPDCPLSAVIDRRLQWKADGGKDYDGWMKDVSLVKAAEKISHEIYLLGLPEQMEALYSQLGLRSILERWGDAPQREANISSLIRAAREYEQRMLQFGEGVSVYDFFSSIDSEEASGDINGLTLDTYHGSKGLEWPVVIMLSMDNDKATADSVMKKSVFGITHIQKAVPDKENLYPETLVTLLPWPYGSRSSNIPEFTKEAIKNTKYFNQVYEQQKKEMMRLLYVGVTRAKDCLIITGSVNDQKWLKSLGIDPESILNTGSVCGITVPRVEEIQTQDSDDSAQSIKVLTPAENSSSGLPRFISPSMSKKTSDPVLSTVAMSDRTIGVKAESRQMSTVGSCIHDIFANEARESVTGRTIRAYGLVQELYEPADVTASYAWLTEKMTELHGVPTQVYHELPFEYKAENGQTVRGEMDMLWETAEGVVLVDFKTHLGQTDDGEGDDDLLKDIAKRNYHGQLALYKEALIRAGYSVTACYLFFPIGGELIRVETDA